MKAVHVAQALIKAVVCTSLCEGGKEYTQIRLNVYQFHHARGLLALGAHYKYEAYWHRPLTGILLDLPLDSYEMSTSLSVYSQLAAHTIKNCILVLDTLDSKKLNTLIVAITSRALVHLCTPLLWVTRIAHTELGTHGYTTCQGRIRLKPTTGHYARTHLLV